MPIVSNGLSDNSNLHTNHRQPLISIRLINRTINNVWPTSQASASTAVTEIAQTSLYKDETNWNWPSGGQAPGLVSESTISSFINSTILNTHPFQNASLPDGNITTTVPYLSLNQSFISDASNHSSNETFGSNALHFWKAISFTHPDILLAFALIIFYVIFVLFICVIVIRIGVAIIFTRYSSGKVPENDRDQCSLNGYTEGELSSSKCRGISGYSNRYRYHQEMTSYAIDRTNSPSMIDEDENES